MKTISKFLMILACAHLLFVACQDDEYVAPPSPGKMIKSFKLADGQIGDEQIGFNAETPRVVVKVSSGADLAHLVPNIVISQGASISPKSGEVVDITQNNVVNYTVTAASGQSLTWRVEFEVVDSDLTNYGAYIIKSKLNGKLLTVQGDTLYNQKYAENALISLETATSANNANVKKYQKWHIIYHTSQDGTAYYKVRNLFTGKYLDASHTAPQEEGAQAVQIGYNPEALDEALELWKIEQTGNAFTFVNKANGKALTNLPGTQLGQSGKAVQSELNNSDSQKWELVAITPETYRDDVFTNFFERNENSMGSVAFDQGNSIPLSWGANAGKVLWVAEDSYDGASLRPNDMFQCNWFFSYNNSILIQPSATDWDPSHTVNITNSRPTSHPRLVFDDVPGTDRIWPGTGVEIGNKVYMYAGEGLGLTNTQNAMYVLTENEGTSWDVERRTPAGVMGAKGWIKGGDGYVYAFETESYSFGYFNYLHVGRFAESDPDTWTFWNGTSWTSTSPTGTTGNIFSGLGNISVDKVNGKWVIMSVDQGYGCDANRGNVYIATADSPIGPFSTPKKVYQITDYINGQPTRYYTVIIHPHSDNGRRELLLSYSVNYGACNQSACTNDGYMDPYYYRIKGIRVPFDLIGL